MVEDISIIRRDVLDFRRSLKPQHSILESLKLKGVEFFGKSTEPYFADIIGDGMRVWNLLENHKETIESLQEANDSLISNRTTRVIRVLTVFSAIFLPLTLIASILNMRTRYLTFIGTIYDLWIVLGIMLAVAVFMLIIFKVKKWL